MSLTPQEIENKQFERRFRGFDPAAVSAFLSAVSDEMTRLIGEIETAHQKSADLQRLVDDHKAREGTIQETLYAVRGLADEIKREARRESDLIVREARIAADRLTSQAREQVSRIEEEISRLRLERDAFEDRVAMAAEDHLRLIEIRKGEGEVRDRLRFLGRRGNTGGTQAQGTSGTSQSALGPRPVPPPGAAESGS